MATKQKEMQEEKFYKEQFLASNKYADKRDAINAVWTDDEPKSKKELDSLLEKFMKGKVN